MIIFLYGEDAYRIREKLKELVEGYQKTRAGRVDLKYFEGGENFFRDFSDSLKQISMFREKKMAVLFNLFDSDDFKEKFLERISDFSSCEEIIIICQQGKINKNTLFFKALVKNAKAQEFRLLDYDKLKVWARNKFENCQARIDSQALDRLIEHVGNDLWRMSNEIQKLASYKKSAEIEVEDVRALVKPKIETDIFETIDAIAQKDKKKALSLFYKHIGKGDSPIYLLTMVNYQFRNLLIIKDLIEKANPYYAIVRKSKLHPFVVKKGYYLAGRFNFADLKKIYQKIFQIDLDVKTGKINPLAALEMLVTEI